MSEICRQNLAHLRGASFYLRKFFACFFMQGQILRFYRAQRAILAQIQAQKGQVNEL
mgnify:CR=1 FL=1